MFSFFKKKSGFTLLKLLIVIVILATITVIAIPIFSHLTNKSGIENQNHIGKIVNSTVEYADAENKPGRSNIQKYCPLLSPVTE